MHCGTTEHYLRPIADHDQVGEFFFIRYVLAFGCALCQTLLFRVISLTLNARIGLFFILATIFSPGNFHASTAYLPSSFAMYMAMLGASSFMNWRGGLKTAQGIFWFAVGAVVGWPFAAALCAPFLVEEALFAALSDTDRLIEAIMRVVRGVVAGLIVLVSCRTDSFVTSHCLMPASSSTVLSTPSSTRKLRSQLGTLSSTTSSPRPAALNCTAQNHGPFTSAT